MNITHLTQGYSLMEAARLLGMNRNKACRWAAKGIIRTVRLPMGRYGKHIVSPEEIERLRGVLSGRPDSS